MQHLLTLEYTLEKDAPRTKCHHAHADAIAGLVRLGLAYEAGASRRGSEGVGPSGLVSDFAELLAMQ